MRTLVAGASLSVFMIACAGITPTTAPTPAPTPTQIGRLTLTETACTLERTAAVIGRGPISLAVFNQTPGVVFVILSQVASGHTYQELEADVRRAIQNAEAGIQLERGRPSYMLGWAPMDVGPGASTAVNQTAQSGTYAIVCARTYENNGQVAPYGLIGPIEIR